MMCSYSFYLILMYFNPQLERCMYRITNTVKDNQTTAHGLGYTGLAPARELGEDETLCGICRHNSEEDGDNVNESLDNKQNVRQVTKEDEKKEDEKKEDEKKEDEKKEDEKEETVQYKSEGTLQDNQEHGDAEDLKNYEIQEKDVEKNILTPEKDVGEGGCKKVQGLFIRSTSFVYVEKYPLKSCH